MVKETLEAPIIGQRRRKGFRWRWQQRVEGYLRVIKTLNWTRVKLLMEVREETNRNGD